MNFIGLIAYARKLRNCHSVHQGFPRRAKLPQKVVVFIVPCFAGIHFTYKTDHERKNLKIPSNSGKFLGNYFISVRYQVMHLISKSVRRLDQR